MSDAQSLGESRTSAGHGSCKIIFIDSLIALLNSRKISPLNISAAVILSHINAVHRSVNTHEHDKLLLLFYPNDYQNISRGSFV